MARSAKDIRYEHLGYVALNVSDLEKSAWFYESIVGLTSHPHACDGAAFFRCSDKHLDLLLSQSSVPGLKRVGWQLQNVASRENAFAYFSDLGLEPKPVAQAETQMLGISDDAFRIREPNSGVVFEFFSAMVKAPGPFMPTLAKIQRLGHVVVGVEDLASAETFCLEHLNFRASDRIEGMVTFLRCFPNRFHHSLGLATSPNNRLHHVNFMVTEIDDIGKAMHRMKRNGVPVTFGPGRHPPSESMFFYYADPDGLWLEYSFGMEEFSELEPRAPRLLPPTLESVDQWGAIPDPNYPQKGEIESSL